MKRRYLKTLVALSVLAVLWVAFSEYNKRQASEPASKTPAERKLFPVATSQVQSFTIKPRNGQAVTVSRNGKAWSITQPTKLLADQNGVSSFLDSLTTASVTDVIAEQPHDVKAFGLDPPATTIEVSTDTKPPHFGLLLGDTTPTSNGLYAQVVGSQRVVTLDSFEKDSLEKTLFDLRDKRAFTLGAGQLSRIETVAKGKSWALEKNPEGVWDLVLPPPVRADHFTVDGLTSAVRSLSMESIVSESKKDLARYGLTAPTLTVKLSGPGGAQAIVVGRKNGSNYDAMNSSLNPVFTLGSDFLTQFQKDRADLRDKGFFSFSSFALKRLDVHTPQGTRVFEQAKDLWKQTAPSAKNEDSAKMDALANQLTELRASSFPKATPGPLAPFGLDKPAYIFKATYGSENQTQTLQIGEAKGHYYARLSTDPLPGEISKADFDALTKALNTL